MPLRIRRKMMNKPKNFAVSLFAFTALLVSPVPAFPAPDADMSAMSVTVNYSELTFSASGGAPLN
ncbi:MAG: hypothetical protein H9W81_13825 [Enterococcus sp.]|nr:hypothetical protein [Enterococcus sp.]